MEACHSRATIEHEDTKLTKLVLHFSDFSTIFYVSFKYYCTGFIGSSDKGVGSSDKGIGSSDMKI